MHRGTDLCSQGAESSWGHERRDRGIINPLEFKLKYQKDKHFEIFLWKVNCPETKAGDVGGQGHCVNAPKDAGD